MNKKITIFYFCNGKNPACKAKAFCGILHPEEDCVCFHTTNPDYAVNGRLEDNPDERPFFVNMDNDGNVYEGEVWEGFVGRGKLEIMEQQRKEKNERKDILENDGRDF